VETGSPESEGVIRLFVTLPEKSARSAVDLGRLRFPLLLLQLRCLPILQVGKRCILPFAFLRRTARRGGLHRRGLACIFLWGCVLMVTKLVLSGYSAQRVGVDGALYSSPQLWALLALSSPEGKRHGGVGRPKREGMR
jgi:hypothetical protein